MCHIDNIHIYAIFKSYQRRRAELGHESKIVSIYPTLPAALPDPNQRDRLADRRLGNSNLDNIVSGAQRTEIFLQVKYFISKPKICLLISKWIYK